MNTKLQKLFENSKVNKKDRFEINQIFELLPPEKKQNVLDNFEILILRLEQQRKEIDLERRILVGDFYRKVEEFYEKVGDKI